MTPLEVVLETSAFGKRGDAWWQYQLFTRLAEWGRNNQIRCLIPYVVQREVTAHAVDLAQKRGTALLHSFKELRRLGLSAMQNPAADEVSAGVEKLVQAAGAEAAQQLADWAAQARAELIPLDETHGARVLDGYFQGDPPFMQRRHRADLPDAFILQTIEDLAQERHNPGDPSRAVLHVVVTDGRLAKACAAVPGVKTYPRLSDFVNSDEVQDRISDGRFAGTVQAVRGSLLADFGWIEQAVEAYLQARLEADELGPAEGWYGEAHVLGIDRVSLLHTDDLAYLGEGQFAGWVAISADVEALLDEEQFWRDAGRAWERDEDQLGHQLAILASEGVDNPLTVQTEVELVIRVEPASLLQAEISEAEADQIAARASLTINDHTLLSAGDQF